MCKQSLDSKSASFHLLQALYRKQWMTLSLRPYINRRKVSVLCLLYEIYHRLDHPMNEYLHHFIAARNARVSAVPGELW